MNTNNEVPVTVLIPVRNGAKWILEAIESILTQNYSNFEILIVDDQSTDESISIAQEVAAGKVRVVKAHGQGLASALAIGVLAADTEIICRLDADDKAHSQRISKQVAFLQDHSEHVMVGSNVNLFSNAGIYLGKSHFPLADQGIRLRMNIGNPFAHSSVTFRRNAVLEAGNYWSPDEKPFPEDYHLWTRLAERGKLANLPEQLVAYRVNTSGLIQSNAETMRHQTSSISLAWYASQVDGGMNPDLRRAWEACFGSNAVISFQDAFRIMRALIRARFSSPQNFNDHGLRLSHYVMPLRRMYR